MYDQPGSTLDQKDRDQSKLIKIQMIVKMTTAGTDQTTWKDVCYNISTGQYQSSSGLLWQITNLQKYIYVVEQWAEVTYMTWYGVA